MFLIKLYEKRFQFVTNTPCDILCVFAAIHLYPIKNSIEFHKHLRYLADRKIAAINKYTNIAFCDCFIPYLIPNILK